jgi:hypothetical protein
MGEPAPALGLSKAFDSLEATVKLAARTGMMEAVKDLSGQGNGSAAEARAMVGEMRNPGWSALDKIIFAVSVTGAAIVGAIIVFA